VALSDNLLHYWSLEEASGDAIDAHGAADLGENVSAIGTAAGKVGNARDIGSAAYFNNAGVGSDSTKSYAVQAWINADTLNSFRTVICFRWDAAGGWWCGFDAGRITFYAGGGGSYPNVTDDVTLSTGTWYHCVWNFAADGSVELFVDGLSVATGTAGRSVTASTGIAVGRDSEDANNPFDGRIDELGLWERVLTSAEVTELYNSGSGRDYAYITSGGDTFTASAAVTIGAATCSGSGEFDAPVYAGEAAVTIGAATASGSGNFDTAVYSGSAAVTAGAATCSAAGEFDPPVYTASAAAIVGAAACAASGEFDVPLYVSSASALVGAATCLGVGAFATELFEASAAVTTGPATCDGIAIFTLPEAAITVEWRILIGPMALADIGITGAADTRVTILGAMAGTLAIN